MSGRQAAVHPAFPDLGWWECEGRCLGAVNIMKLFVCRIFCNDQLKYLLEDKLT